MKLQCSKCKSDYEKPDWYAKETNVFFLWSLKYCDECRKIKERQALRLLPTILNELAKDPTN